MTETGDIIRLVGYVLLLVSCLAAAGAAGPRSKDRRVWLVIGVGGIVLGIAELADFGHVVADAGRRLAGEGGWYGSRRPLQASVILVIAVASMGTSVVLLRAMRGFDRSAKIAVGLAVGLAGFVAVRGISLHQVDDWMNAYPGRVKVTLGETIETWWLMVLVVLAARFAIAARLREVKLAR